MQAVATRPSAEVAHPAAHAGEEQLRADFYRLLALPLSAPPTRDVAGAYARLDAGESAPSSPLFKAVGRLADGASVASPEELVEDYHDLFIGVGRGKLVPYASYYLTGFLQEKPLAKLRQDMARLGVAAASGSPDPEDHVASVLDIMAGLIDGRFGAAGLEQQKKFHLTHVASWMPIFFGDLERTATTSYYAALGASGRAFLDIESAAFEMVA